MMMQGGNSILGMTSDQSEMMIGHSSSDGRRYNEPHSFITKQENGAVKFYCFFFFFSIQQ